MIAELKLASSLIDDQCEAIQLCRDGLQPLDPVKGRGPGRERPDGPGGCGRKAARGRGGRPSQERRIVMATKVASFVAAGTKIDRSEAVDGFYPGFIQQMAERRGDR